MDQHKIVQIPSLRGSTEKQAFFSTDVAISWLFLYVMRLLQSLCSFAMTAFFSSILLLLTTPLILITFLWDPSDSGIFN